MKILKKQASPSLLETVILNLDIFTVRSDGTLISSRQPRIAVGKRRFAVFAKELYDNELSTS